MKIKVFFKFVIANGSVDISAGVKQSQTSRLILLCRVGLPLVGRQASSPPTRSQAVPRNDSED